MWISTHGRQSLRATLFESLRPSLSGALETPTLADASSMMVWLGHGPPGLPGGGEGYRLLVGMLFNLHDPYTEATSRW